MDSRWKTFFAILVFLGNIFQEKSEIQDGRQRSHDHLIEKKISKKFHSYISWSCYGSQKVSFYSMD
jgi:hypothetical protein